MQRCCSKLSRSLFSSSSRLLPSLREPVAFPVNRSILKPLSNTLPTTSHHNHYLLGLGFRSPFPRLPVIQARDFSVKGRSRAPTTPVISKVKKYKIKGYSSFKSRFKPLKDGTIRRWRAGKRHNAHLKSKKSKRRLRRPEIVHAAYAKVMKKLNFCNS